jgi:hypothetical protein
MRTNLLLATLIAGGALTLWVGVSAAPTAHYVTSHADCGMATPCSPPFKLPSTQRSPGMRYAWRKTDNNEWGKERINSVANGSLVASVDRWRRIGWLPLVVALGV